MSDLQRQEFAASHPEWEMTDTSIRRIFRFADFTRAMGFVTQVALLAERANHHPDIDIRWNRVVLTLSTHSQGGLTEKDVELAERIDALV